jgi:hypothetical protein
VKASQKEIDSLENELRKKLQSATNDSERTEALKWFNSEKIRLNEEKDSSLWEENRKRLQTAQDFSPQRVGFVLEAAFAGAYRNDSTSSDLKDDGYALWLTPAYVQKGYSIIGVFRYVKDSLSNKSTEYGARLVMTKNRYALSIEYLKGNYSGEVNLPDRERVSILLEFVVSKKLWATISFGEDNKNLGGENSLFSALGLKFNVSRDRFKFE